MKRLACIISTYIALLLPLVVTVGCAEQDFQGGVRIILEVQADVLVERLARDRDTLFYETLNAARASTDAGQHSFADVFVQKFEQRAPGALLSQYFRDDDAGISQPSSNTEIAQYLRDRVDGAVSSIVSIMRKRLDNFGLGGFWFFYSPGFFVERQGPQRIVVKLRRLDDPERVRNMLEGTASLEFRLMAEPGALQRSLQQIIVYYENDIVSVDSTEADTIFDVSMLLDTRESDPVAGNPFVEVLDARFHQGVVFGQVSEQDTAKVNQLLSDPKVLELLPRDVVLLYTSSPVYTSEDGLESYNILGVINRPELTGDVITDARVEFDPQTNVPQVSITMKGEGSRTWARVTGANVGKNVAIVLDGVVYSYPNVIQKIVGGRFQITGLDSLEEAQDIVTVLKSGRFPAPVNIVEERPMEPSQM